MAIKKKIAKRPAAKKKVAKKKRRAHVAQAFSIDVNVDDGRVYLTGEDGGNIYGSPDDTVTFTCGQNVTEFSFEAIEFKKKGGSAPAHRWPFKGAEPSWPQSGFSGDLKSPISNDKKFYKYTISVDGAVSLDPVIIVGR